MKDGNNDGEGRSRGSKRGSRRRKRTWGRRGRIAGVIMNLNDCQVFIMIGY